MSLNPRHAQALWQTPCQCVSRTRSFSSTAQRHKRTRLRQALIDWFDGPGRNFKHPLPGSTNYLSAYNKDGDLGRLRQGREKLSEEAIAQQEFASGLSEEVRAERAARRRADAGRLVPKERVSDLRVYPLNESFRSESVLSEEMREEVYQQVAVNELDITSVSAAYGIDIRRVAAVVRMKTIEKQWIDEGKPLAKPYNDAVLAMLPQTPFRNADGKLVRHESINDLPVHPATRNQLFWPTSESRKFTREDAAKAFSPTLLPADKRIPHPELIELEKMNIEGVSKEDRIQVMRDREQQARKTREKQKREQERWEEKTQRIFKGQRWDFKFQDISVDDVGPTGRSTHGVGLRYGYAHIDRKKGVSKIPTSVE